MKQLSPQEALYKLAAYCSKAERCFSDLQKKLDTWAIAPDEQPAILERLRKDKFVDEERYARSFIRDKARFAKWGKTKIAFALQQKRISPSLYRPLLDEEIREEESSEVLEQLMRTKNRTIKASTPYEHRNKLIRFALGRGFSMAEALKCANNILHYTGDDE